MDREQIKEAALALGFDRVGIARPAPSPESIRFYSDWLQRGFDAEMGYLRRQEALKQSIDHVLEGTRSAIVVALNYAQPLGDAPGQPKIARYAKNRDYHKVIRKRLSRLADQIQQHYPDERVRACADSAPLFERDLAHHAGLGWFGKNTMLIDSVRGSWFLIGVLLTTLELEPDQPSIGGCGSCRKCIDACPTGALVHANERWQVDSRRCLSYWTIEQSGPLPEDIAAKTEGWTFGCDICQEVCPFNAARESQPLRATCTNDPDMLTARQEPSLNEIAAMTAEEWDQWTRGRPIRRPGYDHIKRMAVLNLEQASTSQTKTKLQ